MKPFHFAAILLAATVALASCKKDKEPEPEPEPKPGVLINGVRWAECNVDAPGTFAATPESPGMYYKWGSKIGWSATVALTSSPAGQAWADVVPESGDNWDMTNNNPCPAGWRVPTQDEQGKLFEADKVGKAWDNTKKGYTFTDIASQKSIFFLAAGNRDRTDGALNNAGAYGKYWSSTMSPPNGAFCLYFHSGDAVPGVETRTYGLPVRCVLQ